MRISDWSSDVCSSDLPTIRKAKQMHEETRNTRHPDAVTEFLMSVLQAVGRPFALPSIEKNTREEVLWKNCLDPWRRSPLWQDRTSGVEGKRVSDSVDLGGRGIIKKKKEIKKKE